MGEYGDGDSGDGDVCGGLAPFSWWADDVESGCRIWDHSCGTDQSVV